MRELYTIAWMVEGERWEVEDEKRNMEKEEEENLGPSIRIASRLRISAKRC